MNSRSTKIISKQKNAKKKSEGESMSQFQEVCFFLDKSLSEK